MLIALLSTLIILCAILLISFLWERRKCLRMQKRLFRESRKLEHTNHVASAILKNVHAFILLINNDFKVLKTNYYQQTGTRKGPEEKRVGDLLQCCNALSAEGGCGTHVYCGSCPIRQAIRQAFEQRRGFTNLEATLNMVTSENQTVACEAVISGSYFLLNEEENMVLTVHDITHLKQVERELKVAKEKAENADIAKSAFLANMSHEIRTPLNALSGFSAILTEESIDNETKQQCNDIIQQNSELLLKLINDVIDLSSLEIGKMQFKFNECDIVALCRNVIDMVEKIKQTQAEVRFSTSLSSLKLTTDSARLQQVLINLLINATKFTAQGTITLELVKQTEDTALFSVSDTGCGISKENQNKIFNRFEKLDENAQGTGLGLSICQLIIEQLGGKIWIDPDYDKGARFLFTHPICHAQIKKEETR